ncbi:multiple antibiotic resistance regulatory protein MarB, partial [Klebsiella pneumoniae]|uniref:multiple antibiotic resistance regulatory protein MarB n=1 Tax=Klebsiella pneumoniae TaxID=573 RepID=UPI00272F8FBD
FSLASILSYAAQNTTPVLPNQRDTMIIPSEHNDSPCDFTHMAAGHDKADALGVPNYQQDDLCCHYTHNCD